MPMVGGFVVANSITNTPYSTLNVLFKNASFKVWHAHKFVIQLSNFPPLLCCGMKNTGCSGWTTSAMLEQHFEHKQGFRLRTYGLVKWSGKSIRRVVFKRVTIFITRNYCPYDNSIEEYPRLYNYATHPPSPAYTVGPIQKSLVVQSDILNSSCTTSHSSVCGSLNRVLYHTRNMRTCTSIPISSASALNALPALRCSQRYT